MIGPKPLSEIKQELSQALGSSPDLPAWLDQRIASPLPTSDRAAKVQEDLLWVQQLLHQAVEAKKPARRKARKRAVKSASTAR